MANVLCALVYLYCSSGCRAGTVASALTFHPPNPAYYDFEESEKSSQVGDKAGEKYTKYKLLLVPDLPAVPREVTRCYSCHLVTTATGTFVPLVLFTHEGAHFTIVVSHGNASDIGAMFIFYALLNIRLKVNVVGYDYTGYGVSMQYGTRPTEEQTYIDADAVYDWVCDYKGGELIPSGVPGDHIIVYGQSVGSGPSCYLASGKSRRAVGGPPGAKDRKGGPEAAPLVGSSGLNCCSAITESREVAGVVLHSPIMSGMRVLTSNRCLSCCDIYPNVDFIKTASAPVFILHGDADREVPVSHGLGLQERVPDTHRTQPWWVRDRGHNDVLRDNEEEFFRRMMAFLLLVRTRQNKAKQRMANDDKGSMSTSKVADQGKASDADVTSDIDSDEAQTKAETTVQMVAMTKGAEKDYKAIAMSAVAA